jgi:para-nitrobenzyl esterase
MMRMKNMATSIRWFGCVSAILFAEPVWALSQLVMTGGGLVSGVVGNDKLFVVFRGIPYAAPPVGDLRWRAPQAAKTWQGVRKAEQFSASCMQNITSERRPWTYEFMTHTEVSEGCL